MKALNTRSERTGGRPDHRGERGFTLTEIVVVVAILAILALIFGPEVPRTFKRQRLAGAANDIRQLVQRGLTEMQRSGTATFVRIGPPTGTDPRSLPIQLIADTNNNGAIDLGTDKVIAEYDIALTNAAGGDVQELSLSTDAIDQVQSSRWLDPAPDSDSTDRSVARALECDFLGRALIPGGAQIAGVATLVLTHRNMVDPASLGPKTRFVVRINPLWSVDVVREIYNGVTWEHVS